MMIQLGCVCELVRYPVKSMAGTAAESALLGWHGLNGDRRYAFRRLGDDSGIPWLTASRFPELLCTVLSVSTRNAGVYGTVVRPGTIHVGQAVSLVPDVPRRS